MPVLDHLLELAHRDVSHATVKDIYVDCGICTNRFGGLRQRVELIEPVSENSVHDVTAALPLFHITSVALEDAVETVLIQVANQDQRDSKCRDVEYISNSDFLLFSIEIVAQDNITNERQTRGRI